MCTTKFKLDRRVVDGSKIGLIDQVKVDGTSEGDIALQIAQDESDAIKDAVTAVSTTRQPSPTQTLAASTMRGFHRPQAKQKTPPLQAPKT